MPASNFVNDASSDAKEQIAQLRSQVQMLMNERVTPALSNAADKAQKYVDQARETYEGQTEALSERVRESPILAVLVAAGVGYLLGRVAR
jgi:ElaB/YqjD/DUF883 family membrane-anchored ribosome-binding protein